MEGYVNKDKWINLNDIPRDRRGYINWKQSVGCLIDFNYDGRVGVMKILDYNSSTQKVTVIDTTRDIVYKKDIHVASLKKCQIGNVLRKTIAEVAPELILYLKNNDDAYKYSPQSNVRINTICPVCGFEKSHYIHDLYRFGFGCPQCSDGKSWAEKFMLNILRQLHVNFKNEINSSDKFFKWIPNNYRYDFYFENKGFKYFLELDGHFHNNQNVKFVDNIKDQIAIDHGIQIIRIDCKYPCVIERFEYVKENILNSEFNTIFDLSLIDWKQASMVATDSNIGVAAQMWNNGMSVAQIADEICVARKTSREYLKVAANLGLCSYNAKTAKERKRLSNILYAQKHICKPLMLYKDGIPINVFCSASELDKMSSDLYGVHMNRQNIAAVCNGRRQYICGYTAQYITREKYEQIAPQFAQNSTKLIFTGEGRKTLS